MHGIYRNTISTKYREGKKKTNTPMNWTPNDSSNRGVATNVKDRGWMGKERLCEVLEDTRIAHVATATPEVTHTGPGDGNHSTNTPVANLGFWLCSTIFPHRAGCFKPSW